MPIVASQEDRFTNFAPLFPWLYPTKMAAARATELQRGVRWDEQESETIADRRAVAVATVHARQDLILVYSMECDIHRQLVKISRGVWALAALALYAVLHFS